MAPLLSVEDAKARLLEGASPTRTELVDLDDAVGRVLARDLKATRSQPPFDASSMDGYAVRFADLENETDFRCVVEIPAGRQDGVSIGPGECARIFTGAPLPDGADTVIIQENATREGGIVRFDDPMAARGQSIRPKGLDFTEGVTGHRAGTLLNPRHIALAAAMNHATIPVFCRPKVAILATGDELVAVGTEPGPSQIIASNSHGILTMCRVIGCDAQDFGIAADAPDAMRVAFDRIMAWDPDVIVTLGGASVGDHDLVRPTLASIGFDLGFWRIAMRPGRPLLFARSDTGRVLGLPGNPVSAMVCGEVFLKPLLRALSGAPHRDRIAALRLDHDLPANGERTHYMRALRTETGVIVFENQDSSLLAMLSNADCLVIREPKAAALAAGSPVSALLLD